MKSYSCQFCCRSLLLLLLAFLSACEKPAAPPPPPEPLKKMFALPPFTLTERSGEPFDSAKMQGKVWICSFFFASCPGPCPILNQRMESLQLATVNFPDVALLSISTDEDDSPAKLRVYAKQFDADARWFFVTGKKDEVFDLSKNGFKLGIADAPGVSEEIKFIHSTKLVLVDRHGWIRGYYDGIGDRADADAALLLTDVQRVLAEK